MLMKFIHISDLHIGKRVCEFNMLEDQNHILKEILRIVDEVKPEGIFIAGDIYDKSIPSGEAVDVFDNFLTDLTKREIKIFIVSGNHDSPERLNFGSRIMHSNGVYIAGTFKEQLTKVKLVDEFGDVNVFLLPFVKPATVRACFPETAVESYEDAVRVVIDSLDVDRSERNVLVAHQFITNAGQQPEISDSETIAIGGLDNIDAAAFAKFDYVALGHLHGPQSIGRESVRYAGSPIKYSFSEARQKKSVTVLEMLGKGTQSIKTIPLIPLRDMIEIKGPIDELVKAQTLSHDFVRAVLTDEGEVYDAIGQLRQVYPNIMNIDFENNRSKQNVDSRSAASGDVARKSPLDLFEEFYRNQNNEDMSDEQRQIVKDVFEKIGGAGI